MQRFGTGKKTWFAMVLLVFIFALSLDTVLAAPQKSDKKAAEKHTVTAATGMRFENFPDMSDFDPSNPVIPTGDTIKIAIVGSFSGPAAITGQLYFMSTQWAAHAINKKAESLWTGRRS